MGSPCEVLLETASEREARAASELVASEAWRIEDKFSRYVPGNIVHRINSADGANTRVDDETARLLEFASTLHGLSGGKFDITSGVLREVWTFDGSDRIPDRAAVSDVLCRVGWGRVTWNTPDLALQPGMEIDLGGIGKEYAVDRCLGLLTGRIDIPALVNFGGDLAVSGPPAKRPAWKVAVEGPEANAPLHLVDLRQGAIATSGDARRYLEKDGIRYGHILDPESGWPIADAPRSITVAADTCTQAGMLSTLAMLRGGGAESFLDDQSVRFWSRR
jgi:thiamine biosynthesis lipoprotein